MTRYIIALSELGLNNANLISLLIQHPCDIVNMFENKNQNLFEKYLDLLPYYDLFSDSAAVASSYLRQTTFLPKIKNLELKQLT